MFFTTTSFNQFKISKFPVSCGCLSASKLLKTGVLIFGFKALQHIVVVLKKTLDGLHNLKETSYLFCLLLHIDGSFLHKFLV
jgi:hypothetical protein